jgi:hypothetical protein
MKAVVPMMGRPNAESIFETGSKSSQTPPKDGLRVGVTVPSDSDGVAEDPDELDWAAPGVLLDPLGSGALEQPASKTAQTSPASGTYVPLLRATASI